jgi:hypothetical protein
LWGGGVKRKEMSENSRLHAVMVPFPLQGCITPHLQLAQHLISSYDFFVTFVNTTYNHERLMGLQAAETRQLE